MSHTQTIHIIDDVPHIYVWPSPQAREPVAVPRLSRRLQRECQHLWCGTANAGHGKWRRGCYHCGSLSR